MISLLSSIQNNYFLDRQILGHPPQNKPFFMSLYYTLSSIDTEGKGLKPQ